MSSISKSTVALLLAVLLSNKDRRDSPGLKKGNTDMCIEKELAANTAALTALTAAISQLIGSLSGGSRCSCDCRDVVVEPSAPAAIPQQTPAPAAPEQPKVAPAPTSAPMDLNAVRAVCVRAGQAGLTQDVVAFLTSAGVKLLTELPPDRYPDLLAMLAAKGVQ